MIARFSSSLYEAFQVVLSVVKFVRFAIPLQIVASAAQLRSTMFP